jgi:hypothetical protein
MRHVEKPGRGWQVFAGVMVVLVLIGDVPKLLHPQSLGLGRLLLIEIYIVALAGLVAYAFGKRFLPTRFWRVFAPAYCLLTAGQLGWSAPAVASLTYLGLGSPAVVFGFLIVVVPVVSMATFTCIAVLRQASLLGPNRRPLGERPAQLALPFA